MSNKQMPVVLVAALAGFACLFPGLAMAGLSRPPPSFIVLTRDGKQMLVMLSPVPIVEDEGNVCTLPSGRQVKLRETFSSSGLYKVGSTIPIWTVDWYGEKGLVCMSKNGRYVVRVNRFGGDHYGKPVSSHWGVRFYNSGVQIKNYDVNELVNYPSLMEFTSSDWHFLWIDDSVYDTEVRDGFIVLKTTTHERYRFDVSTGEIVEEVRFWSWMARGGLAILAAFGLVGGWLVYRRRNTKTDGDLSAIPVQPARFTFSIRSLFVLTTLIAGLCAVYLVAVHVAVFLTSALVSVYLLILAVRTRRRVSSPTPGFFTRFQRAILWLVVSTSWFFFYALSLAPVMSLAMRLDLPNDARMVLAQVGYAPVWWLYINTPIHQWELAINYFRGWGL